MRRLAAAVLLLVSATACGGGGARLGAQDEPRTVLQLRAASDGELLREVELEPTAGATEPVLAGDVVLVTTSEGLAAIDLGSGARRWTEPGALLPAAVVGDVVVVDGRAAVSGRRTDGTLLWSRPTGASVPYAWDEQPGRGVLLLDDGTPPDDGTCGSEASPCVPRVAARSGGVELLEARTGEARWSVRLDCRPEPARSALSSTLALVGCGLPDGSSRLTALRLDDGGIAWTWSARSDLRAVAVRGSDVAVLVGDEARGLDPVTGGERWSVRTRELPSRGSPLLGSDGRSGFLRDPLTGERSTGAVAMAYGLGVHDGLLVGADLSRLRAVRAADGRELWSSPLPGGERPITHLDVDERHVVSITSVGQEEHRD